MILVVWGCGFGDFGGLGEVVLIIVVVWGGGFGGLGARWFGVLEVW